MAGKRITCDACQDGKLIIEPEAKRKNIKELFADFDGNYSPVEIDWGDPVGDELW